LLAQSLAALHPHKPEMRQAVPLALPLQLLQIVPTAPQAACAVPGWQVPLADAEQQPDWHAVDDEQALMHKLPVHDDAPAWQSLSMLQPHCPPPATTTQRWPFWLLPQGLQVPPLLPQAATSVPVWQVPPDAAEQQPVLHGVLASHAEPQVCVAMLHA